MKRFWLVLLFCLIGSIAVSPAAQDSNKWWEEAKTLGKKVAKLKEERYEAIRKLEDKLYKMAEREAAKRGGKYPYELYVELRQQAAPEFAAIRNKYDPQITEAMNLYVTFLRAGQQEELQINAASKELRPEFLYQEKAKYTEAARQNRVEGVVLLSIVFTADGRVTNVRVVRGLPDGLDDQAVKVANELLFLPAVKNGRPVSVRMSVEYSFRLF